MNIKDKAKVLILCIIIVVIGISFVKVVNSIEKYGVKDIIERIWYGSGEK